MADYNILDKTISINEIFLSIQGESINTCAPQVLGVGTPTIFVRTFGCNLDCEYCDTVYAWKKGTRTRMSISNILDEVKRVGNNYKTVCITGGEPGIHKNIGDLIVALKQLGYTVGVETAGSVDIDMFLYADSVVMDFKGPSAGTRAMEKMLWDNFSKLEARDQLKFLVSDRKDWDYMVDVLKKSNILTTLHPPVILVSPVFDKEGKSNARQVVEWILESGLPVVLNLQIHKIIWDVNKRGV